MAYKVKIEGFEGPFDLLLYLVSKKKVDIGSVSITEIADQYLEEVSRMQTLDLDIASDFLLVASTLLELKAQALIPQKREGVEAEIAEMSPIEARAELVRRLLEYKKYRSAADSLYQRYLQTSRMHARAFGPDAVFLQKMPDFLEGVTLDSLGLLAANALARREVFLLESEHIASAPLPVETHVRAIHARLASKKHSTFSELISDTSRKDVIVVTFLAILELYKRQMVTLTQDATFGDIAIDFIEGSGELILDDLYE